MANESAAKSTGKPSALVDTRVIYCGDNLEQLKKLPDACVHLIYIDPPFNSNRNYEVFWGETKEKRAFEDRHENTRAYIDYMRPRCVQLARVLKIINAITTKMLDFKCLMCLRRIEWALPINCLQFFVASSNRIFSSS